MSMGKRWVAVVAVIAAVAVGAGLADAGNGAKPPQLEFLGQAIVPSGTMFAGTTVGGLSSITYDSARGVFYSLSDDQSVLQPARFYTLTVDVSDGRLDNGDVQFRGVTTLPVCVGFGISQPDQARTVAAMADGVVVGSAIVRAAEESVEAAVSLAQAMRAAIDER